MAMLGRGSALQRTATSTSAPALNTSRRPARRAACAALVTEAPQLKPQSRNGNGVVGTNGPTIINGQVGPCSCRSHAFTASVSVLS